MPEFVEISESLSASIKDADERIDALSDQLRKAEWEKQSILDTAISEIAEFKVGQKVLSYGKLYRVTKVYGEIFGLTGHAPKIWLRYTGERLKVNGESTGRERRLYNAVAISEANVGTS